MVSTREKSTGIDSDFALDGNVPYVVTTIGHIKSDDERTSMPLIGRIENGIITDVYTAVTEYSDVVVVEPILPETLAEMAQRDQLFFNSGFSHIEQEVLTKDGVTKMVSNLSINPNSLEYRNNIIRFSPLKIAVLAASGSFTGIIHSEQTWHIIQSVGSELTAHRLSNFTSGERDRLTVGELVNVTHDLDGISLLDLSTDTRRLRSAFHERDDLDHNHVITENDEVSRSTSRERDDLDLDIYDGEFER